MIHQIGSYDAFSALKDVKFWTSFFFKFKFWPIEWHGCILRFYWIVFKYYSKLKVPHFSMTFEERWYKNQIEYNVIMRVCYSWNLIDNALVIKFYWLERSTWHTQNMILSKGNPGSPQSSVDIIHTVLNFDKFLQWRIVIT